MTTNQLTLGRLMEDRRHNKATESLGLSNLGELKRHNVQQEQIGFSTLGETQRHNIATETYQGNQADAYALKAIADAGYTTLEIQHYIDKLDMQWAKLAIDRQNADTNALRAEIDQQMADIAGERAFWQNLRDAAGSLKDVAGAAGDVVGSLLDMYG